MAYKDLSHFISVLESAGELTRVKEFVSPRLEITEIADRFVKNGGKALLFENNGTDFPLLINTFGTEKRMCMAFGVERLDDISDSIRGLFHDITSPKPGFLDKLKLIPSLKQVSSWMPKRTGKRGPCQEVVMEKPDLARLPVLTCWPHDGGPFITLPVVHTLDPETGIRNTGMYRMQVFGPDSTGMHWHLHKGSASHFEKYKTLRHSMPVSVTLGGDPVYTYVATAPLPENIDEYLLAGFLRKKKVEMVKCLTNDLEVPADVDFVIEGYVDPMEEPVMEGPFGDHTGFYSLADRFPKFHVTCITHRKNAVYPATIVGIPPMEDKFIGLATERIFRAPMQISVVPELTDIHMPAEGVFHNIVLTRIEKKFPGQAVKVMNALWGAGQMMFNKVMVVTDGDARLTDSMSLVRLVCERTDPANDIHFLRGPVDILDHSSRSYAYGSKMGIDATAKDDAKPETAGIRNFLSGGGFAIPAKKIPSIKNLNTDLLDNDIPVVILGIEKTHEGAVRQVAADLARAGLLHGIKFCVLLDSNVDIFSLPDVVWIAANNIDPGRDCFIEEDHCLFIDGTRKSQAFDNFSRDWPNVIVMDDQTIETINKKWDSLAAGPFLPSPSLKYKLLKINDGAVVS
jgi:4-hydroxy-3-polyprenylbenzoate decarboxylase